MGTNDLASYRSRLEAMLAEIIHKGNTLLAGMSENYEYCADETDRATQESERDMLLLMQARDRASAKSIMEALRRLDNGEYGICEECGEDISPQRLQAQPMATLCVACKSRLEGGSMHSLALAG